MGNPHGLSIVAALTVSDKELADRGEREELVCKY